MTERKYTRAEISEIIYAEFNNFYRVWSNEMTLGEKLLFSEIKKNIFDGVDYKLDKLEKGDGND